MNKIINKSLLAEDKFIAEMHLRQPEFTYRQKQKQRKNTKT